MVLGLTAGYITLVIIALATIVVVFGTLFGSFPVWIVFGVSFVVVTGLSVGYLTQLMKDNIVAVSIALLVLFLLKR